MFTKIRWMVLGLFLVPCLTTLKTEASKYTPARTMTGYAEDDFGMGSEKIKLPNGSNRQTGRGKRSRQSRKKKGKRSSQRQGGSRNSGNGGMPTLNLRMPL